jgi:acylglycerol lipase
MLSLLPSTEAFTIVANRGILVTAIDRRGWGKSVKKPADRGNTGPTSQILAEDASFIQSQFPSAIPVFLGGHSMGGGETIALASTPEYASLVSQLRGIILEAPYIRLSPETAPSGIESWIALNAAKLFPSVNIKSELKPAFITRDPAVQENIRKDELCHFRGTLEMFSNMMTRAADIDSGKYALNEGTVKSILVAHGSGDQITSYDASKKWFERQMGVEDKELKTYDGWSHILHADLPDNKEVFPNDLADWILKRSS